MISAQPGVGLVTARTGRLVIDNSLAITNFLVIIAAAILLQRVKKISSSFVLIIYSFVFVITVASILHLLYASYIIGASLILYGVITHWLKAPELELDTKGHRNLYLLLSLCIPLFTFQVLQGFIGGQDARTAYLPMSRLLFENPDLQTKLYYEEIPLYSRRLGFPPVLIGLCTTFYSIFGKVGAEIAGLVPSIFFVGFLTVLFRWCEDAGARTTTAAVLVLFSPILIEKCSWFYFECPLLFSTTLLFYSIWKFSVDGEEKYLFYAMMGSCMALMFKYTGIFFTLMLVYYILRNRGLDRRIWILFFVIHLPCMMWYLRNIYYFGNPVLPYLNFLTSDEVFRSWQNAATLLVFQEAHQKWNPLLFNILILPISLPALVVWAVIFPFTSLRKNKVHCLSYVLFCIFLPMWLSFNTDARYLIPFYGAVLLQLSVTLKDYSQQHQLSLSTYTGPKGRVALFLFSLTLILCLQFIYVKRIFPDHVSPDMDVISFLRNKEGVDKSALIFTDTDHVIAWNTGWTVFEPAVPKLAPDFLEARKTKNFYALMNKYCIKYVVNHPWISPWEDDTFSAIERDHEHFVKILDNGSIKIWKVLY